MKNQIKILDNSLVEMVCKDTQDDKNIKVYFQEDVLEHVRTFDVEWKSWSRNRTNKVIKFIGATFLKPDGKQTNIQLKKIIGDYLYGEEKKFTLLNSNHFDLRSANIFPYESNSLNKIDTQKQTAVLRSNLAPLESIITTNTVPANTTNIKEDSIRVYEQGEQIIVIDLEKEDFILTLDKKYVDAIMKKLS